jgi:hypothetical protein
MSDVRARRRVASRSTKPLAAAMSLSAVLALAPVASAQSPSPGPSPRSLPSSGPVEPGTYVSSTLGPSITFTIDEGWQALGADHPDEGFLLLDEGIMEGRLAGFTVTTVAGEVFADPCDMASVMAIEAGHDSVIGFLAANPALEPQGEPEPTEVSGFAGQQLDVRASLPPGCEEAAFLFPLPVSAEFHLTEGETARFIAFDVDDRTIVLIMETYPDVDFEWFVERATRVVDSMVIEPADSSGIDEDGPDASPGVDASPAAEPSPREDEGPTPEAS